MKKATQQRQNRTLPSSGRRPCKTPPLMLMQMRLLKKRVYLINSLACSLARSLHGKNVALIHARNAPLIECGAFHVHNNIVVCCSLPVHPPFTALLTYVKAGTVFNSLATSFGAIWLFCKLRTWLPLRSFCRPSATFQLSESSMRKTYFFPSPSRIDARRICRFLDGCVPV